MNTQQHVLSLSVLRATSYVLIALSLLMCILYLSFDTALHTTRTAPIASQNLTGQNAVTFLQNEGILQQLTNEEVEKESFIQIQKLRASDGAADDIFGVSVAVSGDTLVVGAYNDKVGANPSQGSAYVFVYNGTNWIQQAHLTASDGAADDHFGWAVALHGETALVSANKDDINGLADVGSVYAFVRNGVTWRQQAKLLAFDGTLNDWFGGSLALDGDTALIGTYLDDVTMLDQGSAYVFVRNGTTWTQQAQLVAPDGFQGDFMGASVALSGETALVSSHVDTIGGIEAQGSAHVFVRSGTTWTHQAKLTASDGAPRDYFGEAVALDGEIALIGAYGHAIHGNDNQGAAYIFTRKETIWTQQVKLTASNGAADDEFGTAVALSGERVIIGARADTIEGRARQGSAYAFIRNGATWSQEALLVGSDGAADDYFGTSVAISGETVVVGAYGDDISNKPNQGSTFVFTHSPFLWQENKVTASDSVEQDEFGYSVALSGETALVGAPSDDVGSNKDQGSVYVFVRSGEVWTKQAQLIASDGVTLDRFGDSIDLDRDTALIGAFLDDVAGTIDQGSAYVFVRNGTSWTQQAQLIATDGTADNLFGSSVALHGDTAIIGAPSDSINSNQLQGSAYVFIRNGTTWTQQAQLIASDGASVDEFGYSIDLEGDTALIGSVSDDVAGKQNQGSAYVFIRNGTIWTQQAQLIAANGRADDFFGMSVALDGDTAITGAPEREVNSNLQGSVYVFTRNDSIWTQQAQLTASDGAPSDDFGVSLALHADVVLVGAGNDDVGVNSDQGSVYVFARNGTTWTQQAQLTASDGARNDLLGRSLAFDGSTALIGVPGDNIGANVDQGSTYLFERLEQTQFVFLPLVAK